MPKVIDLSGNWPIGVSGTETPLQTLTQEQVSIVGSGSTLSVAPVGEILDGSRTSLPVGLDPNNNVMRLDPIQPVPNGALDINGILRLLRATIDGALIMQPYAGRDTAWQWSTAGTPITTNTTTVVKSGVQNKRVGLTSLQFIGSNATATELRLLDGTTVIWNGYSAVSMLYMSVVHFPMPLYTSPGAALSLVTVTTGANIFASAQGFVSQ